MLGPYCSKKDVSNPSRKTLLPLTAMEYRMGALFSGSEFAKKLLSRKEAYGNTTPLTASTTQPGVLSSAPHETVYSDNVYNENPGLISISTVILVIAEVAFYIIIGGFASWLSWTSNSSIGWHPVFCVIFSILSFFFAGSYLIGHLLFKLDLLSALRAAKTLLPSPRVINTTAAPISNPVRSSQPQHQAHGNSASPR